MYIYILYIYINICICICVVFPSVQDYSYIWEYICIDPSLQTCKHLQLQSCFLQIIWTLSLFSHSTQALQTC